MILCWAAFTAILSYMWPKDQRLDTPENASDEKVRKSPILDIKSCSDLNQYAAIVNKLPAYNSIYTYVYIYYIFLQG